MLRIEKDFLCFNVSYNGKGVVIESTPPRYLIKTSLLNAIRNGLTITATYYMNTIQADDKIAALIDYFTKRKWKVTKQQAELTTNELDDPSITYH